ncbi:MAG: hypothetical protein J1F09_07260 [Oscillospiraceae bacterium]|nr:hypothetical protein [Oscillospiraceae bacterium]
MYYSFRKSRGHNTIEITFDYWDMHPHSRDPFYAIVEAYAAQNDLTIRTVDYLYNYKFNDDPFDVQFYWFAGFTIYVFVPVKRNLAEVRKRLGMIVYEQNKMLRKIDFPRYTPWKPPPDFKR